MLSLLNSFEVPGLSHITIFPDNLSPFKFYYYRNQPKVSVDSKSGLPNIHYQMVQYSSKDGDIDTQFGYLNMTVDLGLTKEEDAQVRAYLEKKLSDPDYKSTMKLFYPRAHEKLESDGISPSFLELGGLGVVKDAKVTLGLYEGFGKEMQRSASTEVIPAHSGNYAAPLYASFGKAGSELMLRCLRASTEIGGHESSVPTSATVNYTMKAPFYVPAIEATITVKARDFYKYVKDSIEDEKTLDGMYFGYLDTDGGVKGNFENGVIVFGEVLLSEKEIKNKVRSFHKKKGGIQIDIADYSALSVSSKDEVSEKIINSMIDIVTNSIVPSLFEITPVPTPTPSTDTSSSSSSGKDAEKSEEEKKADDYVAKMVHYKLKDTVKQTEITDITFTFTKSSMVYQDVPAGCTIAAIVPEKYKDNLITYVDLQNTEFVESRVNVSADLDFAAYHISSLELEMIYDKKDVRFTETSRPIHEEYVFKTGEESFTFKFFLAKDKSGDYMADYRYRTKVNYVGKGPIGDNDGWSDWKEVQTHNLLIGFADMGFINVECRAGDIDWDLLKSFTVDINYPAVQGKPDTATKLIFKSGDEKKSWSCFKYGKDSNEYTYEVQYVDLDGNTYNAPMRTTALKEITIDDLYEGQPLEANFLVDYSPDYVNKVMVEVAYDDDKLKVHKKFQQWIEDGGGSWRWSMNLRKGGVEEFRYRYYVSYKDGSGTKYTDWVGPVGRKDDIEPFSVSAPNVVSANIMVQATPLRNWADWDFANVFVRYVDKENGINFDADVIILDPGHLTERVTVNCPPETAKPFLCSAEIYTKDGKLYTIEEKEYTRAFTLTKPAE